jgi:hypothetical protein
MLSGRLRLAADCAGGKTIHGSFSEKPKIEERFEGIQKHIFLLPTGHESGDNDRTDRTTYVRGEE